MKYLSIFLSKEISEEEATQAIEGRGLEILYFIEGDSREFGVSFFEGFSSLVKEHLWIEEIALREYEGIDWEEQWSLHTEGDFEGEFLIDLHPFGINNSYKMVAGPGFGNLSHPTTKLTLTLFLPLIKEQNIVDIGSGSGVLSLAAIAAGANHVSAVDIDPLALEHTEINAKLNKWEKKIHCFSPEEISLPEKGKLLLLMNMIESEQQLAWNSLKDHLSGKELELVTSGILTKDKESYLQSMESLGFKLMREIAENEWSAFYFRYHLV